MAELTLRLAGMVRELGPAGPRLTRESIFEAVADEELPDVAEVVRYLRAGHVLIDVLDVANDAFDPEQQVVNGPTIRTDGDWLWREDLAYYVRRHRVRLPEDFLALIRARNYVVPPRDEELLAECAAVAEKLVF